MKLAALAITVVVSINLIAQKHQSTPVEFGEINKGVLNQRTHINPSGEYNNNIIYFSYLLFKVDESLNLNLVGNKKDYTLKGRVYRYKDFLYTLLNESKNDIYTLLVKKINMNGQIISEISIPIAKSQSSDYQIIQSDDGRKLYCLVSLAEDGKGRSLTLVTINLDDELKFDHKTSEIDLGKMYDLDINELILKDNKLYFTLTKKVSSLNAEFYDFLGVINIEGELLSMNELSSEKATLWNTTISKNPKSGKINIAGLFHIKELEDIAFNGFFTAEADPNNFGIKHIKSIPLDKEILSYLDDKFIKRGKTTIYGWYVPSIVQLDNGGYYAIFEHIKKGERKLDELIVYYVDSEGEIQNQNIVPKSQNGDHETNNPRNAVQEFFCYTENNTLNIIHNGNIKDIDATTYDEVEGYLRPTAAFHIQIKPTGEMTKRLLFDYKKGTDKFYLKPQSIYLDKSNMTAVGAFTDKKKKAKMGKFNLSNF